jgi:predicted nuclease with TOPRIM domain
MISEDSMLEQQQAAQEQIREGLKGIEQVQAQLFEHLERMAGHIVALEAVLEEALRSHRPCEEDIRASIRRRVTAGGAPVESADYALNVASSLLLAARSETRP